MNLSRYSYPPVAAAILSIVCDVVVNGARSRRNAVLNWLTGAVCALALFYNTSDIVAYYGRGFDNLTGVYSDPWWQRDDVINATRPKGGLAGIAVRRMQNAMPPGETILERIDFPFLMNFRRDLIFVVDWPGAAGPAPGWPSDQSPRHLAAYLTGLSIRYIAYAHGNEAMFPAAFLTTISRDAWVWTAANRTVDFQRSLSEMMRICPLVFKDETRAVIYLSPACVDLLPD